MSGEGWVYIGGARFWHYVGRDGRSLCGKWMYLGSTAPELGKDDSPDNCKGCRKKLGILQARAALHGGKP
jgi:hypothetical protein